MAPSPRSARFPRLAMAGAAALTAALGVPVLTGSPTAPARAASASACADQRSWLAGTVDLCEGVLVYRDYVYDDYGADDPTVPASTRPATGTLSRPAGDARYDEANVNSADLVDLKLWLEGDQVKVEAELGSLFNADSTILAVAIDPDNDPTTGGGPWGDLIAMGSTTLRSDGWQVVATFDQGDPATNRIIGSFPVPAGAGDVWRVQAVTAKKDKTVMNVAFRGVDERTATGAWWEDRQAAALASGDISEFGHTVEVAKLRAGLTERAPLVPGFHQRVYTSAYTLAPGEGVNYAGVPGRHGDTGSVCEQEFHFLGRYQPYGVFVPDNPAPHGVQLALHGCAANHSSLVDQPGLQQQMGTDLNRLVVVPLGRGPVGYYSDISERDVLDVLADVTATYAVDRDRVFAGGYSMGGYGAFRMSMLYPELFAGFVSWVGFTGDCANNPATGPGADCESGGIGNVIHYTRNTLHVPGVMLYGGADELVTSPTAVAMMQSFKSAGAPYAWYMHPAAEHFTFALLDRWPKEAAYTKNLVRVSNPARVVYRYDPTLAYPQYDLAHDDVYWVSAIRGRVAGFSDLDLTTSACGGSLPAFTTGNSAGAEPVPWVSDFRNVTGSTPIEQRDHVEGSVVNVASLSVDAAATCLAGKALSYKLTTDGPVTVRLSDARTITLTEAGTHEGTLAAAPGSTNTPAGDVGRGNGELPATGGGAGPGPAVGLLALALGLAAGRARRWVTAGPRL